MCAEIDCEHSPMFQPQILEKVPAQLRESMKIGHTEAKQRLLAVLPVLIAVQNRHDRGGVVVAIVCLCKKATWLNAAAGLHSGCLPDCSADYSILAAACPLQS